MIGCLSCLTTFWYRPGRFCGVCSEPVSGKNPLLLLRILLYVKLAPDPLAESLGDFRYYSENQSHLYPLLRATADVCRKEIVKRGLGSLLELPGAKTRIRMLQLVKGEPDD